MLQGRLRLRAAQAALQRAVYLADAAALELKQFLPDLQGQHTRQRCDDLQRQARFSVEQVVQVRRLEAIEARRVEAPAAHVIGHLWVWLPHPACGGVRLTTAGQALAC